MRLGHDRTRNPWICSQTHYRLRYLSRRKTINEILGQIQKIPSVGGGECPDNVFIVINAFITEVQLLLEGSIPVYLMSLFHTDHESSNINKYYKIFNQFVMFYFSAMKQVRNTYEYSWDLPQYCDEFTMLYNNLFGNTARKLGKHTQIGHK